MPETIRFRLNGRPVSLQTDGTRKLLWVLRDELELTGTKYGCGEGVCGSCTVLVDGQAVRSCQADLASVQGKAVVTIEGLARGERLHPLQQAFHEHGGLQCGYCTPGMILGAHALLQANPHPTREQIVAGMEGHLCRCGAHQRIVAAIEAVAGGRGGRDE
jgi:aerobic-type carbon monoxide dehydrogenase small subunit (CoxS/CutS family)